MIARLHQATGRFDTSIYVVAVVLACSLVLPLIAKRPQARDRDKRVPVPTAA